MSKQAYREMKLGAERLRRFEAEKAAMLDTIRQAAERTPPIGS